VPEDEYFSFSTRFEVLEAATELLQEKLVEGGYEGAEFGPEDYEVGANRLNS
jgi:hypothetical protein